MSGELLDPATISDVTCRHTRHRAGDGTAVHVLAFAGTYRHGSAGSPDADVMCGQVAAALATWTVRALVYDFRELDYQWGDGMIRVLSIEEPEAIAPIGSAIAVGPRSGGLRSLCEPSGLHDDLAAAIEAAAAEARAIDARDELGDRLVLHVVVDDALDPDAAAHAAATAPIRLVEHRPRDWRVRAWRCGTLAIEVRRAPADELAALRAEPDAWAVVERGQLAAVARIQ